MPEYNVTVADRLRTLSNSELAKTLVDYISGVIANTVDKFDIKFTPNKSKYIEVLHKQLAEITSEKPRQYTVEELRDMRGEKIYICHINACAGFYRNKYVPYYGDKQRYINDGIIELESVHLPLAQYGSSWIAFTYEPRDFDDKDMPLAERLNSYDTTIFKNMSTCQLVNEQRRIEKRLETATLSTETVAALSKEKTIVDYELERRRKNDPL